MNNRILGQKVIAVRNHLKIPFFNNAYSLIVNQAVSAILGMVFWMVVTRFFSSSQLGLGSGLYSAALLLTSLASLGFGDGLIYYLPRVAHPVRLINTYFCVSGFVALFFTGVFIICQRWFSPGLEIINESFLFVVLFLLSTLIIHFSILQDGLFIADRVAKYSLTKNILANLLRFPFLALLFNTKEWALILSAGISILIGSLFLGKHYKLNNRSDYRFKIDLDPLVWKPLLGFSFGNYIMNTVVSLPGSFLPLLVLNNLGPAENGYFYIAWMIPSMLDVIGRSFGSSLFVESGLDFNSIKQNIKRSLITSTIVLIPSVILLSFFSKYILLIFGSQYSLKGITLMRLLLISCIPLSYYGIFIGVLKSLGRVKTLLILGFIFSGLHIGGAFLLISNYGLEGLGYSVLIARLISFFIALFFIYQEFSRMNKSLSGRNGLNFYSSSIKNIDE